MLHTVVVVCGVIVFFGIFVCYCAEMFSSTHGGEFCGGGEGEEEVEAEAESDLQLSEGRARWRRAQHSNRYIKLNDIPGKKIKKVFLFSSVLARFPLGAALLAR